MNELGKLLPRFLNKHVRGNQAPVIEVLSPLWSRIAGKAMAEQSRPVAFGNGTLTLAAFNAPWATELRGLHHEILTAVNRTLGRPLVKRVRVKLAPSSSSDSCHEAAWAVADVGTNSLVDGARLRMSALPDTTRIAGGYESDLGLQAGLDPEIRAILLRSFAKYFARPNGMVN